MPAVRPLKASEGEPMQPNQSDPQWGISSRGAPTHVSSSTTNALPWRASVASVCSGEQDGCPTAIRFGDDVKFHTLRAPIHRPNTATILQSIIIRLPGMLTHVAPIADSVPLQCAYRCAIGDGIQEIWRENAPANWESSFHLGEFENRANASTCHSNLAYHLTCGGIGDAEHSADGRRIESLRDQLLDLRVVRS